MSVRSTTPGMAVIDEMAVVEPMNAASRTKFRQGWPRDKFTASYQDRLRYRSE